MDGDALLAIMADRVDEAFLNKAARLKVVSAASVFEIGDWAVKSRPNFIRSNLAKRHNTIFTPNLGAVVAAVRYEIELFTVRKIIDFFAPGTLALFAAGDVNCLLIMAASSWALIGCNSLRYSNF